MMRGKTKEGRSIFARSQSRKKTRETTKNIRFELKNSKNILRNLKISGVSMSAIYHYKKHPDRIKDNSKIWQLDDQLLKKINVSQSAYGRMNLYDVRESSKLFEMKKI